MRSGSPVSRRSGRGASMRGTAASRARVYGSAGARSSMTVPLLVHDQVIGTFNVESPVPNAFGPAELQFAELFARAGETVKIDAAYVQQHVGDLAKNADLSRFIL